MANINVTSIESLFKMDLIIPDYQRPYKWTNRNVSELLGDIDNAIRDSQKYENFKYRVGTIILHKENERYAIVDGQQRAITFVLLALFLDEHFNCSLLSTDFSNKQSQENIHSNYRLISDWFSLKDNSYKASFKEALNHILQVVIIIVEKDSEAFQLFDSQNTRGRPLDPHDLLKAYHLREMKDYPYEMQHAVTKWEAVSSKEIRELFELYLFPIKQWTSCNKTGSFSVKDIDVYKGINENSSYSYARRASKATPYFQITEPFIAGNDFFEMVEHYLILKEDVEKEISYSKKFSEIHNCLSKKTTSTGFRYAKNLFICAVLCYYDRFRNFDEQSVKKLFSWAFMLRVDMKNLGFESINKYAIGETGSGYTNETAMFSRIRNARLHSDIANMQISVLRVGNAAKDENWEPLYEFIKKLNGYEVTEESK
jgi:uncharacterized protein with ParB-like and HNH nuclease domain